MKKTKMVYKTLESLKDSIESHEWELQDRAKEDGFKSELITIADARLIVVDEDDEILESIRTYLGRKFPKLSEIKEIISDVEKLEGSYKVLYDTEARAWDCWSDRLSGECPYPIGDSIQLIIYKT